MALNCEILLPLRKQGIYKCGEPVSGTIKYTLQNPMTFGSIIVSLEGKLRGNNPWAEPEQDLISKEVFVSLQKQIIEGEQKIEAGIHEYPFQFQLPEELPSTFKDKTCTISYRIQATFVESGLFDGPKNFRKDIYVLGNVKPHSDELSYGFTKTPSRLDKKPIDIDIDIDKTLVMAGDPIKVKYTISNESDVAVNGIKTKLVSETTYIYHNKRKKVHREAFDHTVQCCRGAKANSEVKITCFVPTSLGWQSIQNSKFLKREYKLCVTAVLPFPHRDASMEIPIAIEGRTNLTEEELIDKQNLYWFPHKPSTPPQSTRLSTVM